MHRQRPRDHDDLRRGAGEELDLPESPGAIPAQAVLRAGLLRQIELRERQRPGSERHVLPPHRHPRRRPVEHPRRRRCSRAAKWGRTKLVVGGEYLATRPQTAGHDQRPQRGGRRHQRVRRLPPDDDRRSRSRSTSWPRLASTPIRASTAISSRRAPRSSSTGLEQHVPSDVQSRLQLADVVLVLPRSVFGADAGARDAGADPRQSAEGRLEFARSCTGGAAGTCACGRRTSRASSRRVGRGGVRRISSSHFASIVAGLPLSIIGPADEPIRRRAARPLDAAWPIHSRTPSDRRAVGSVLVDLSTQASPSPACRPTTRRWVPNFANTWEVGYKGFLVQAPRPGDGRVVPATAGRPDAQMINPGVLFNPTQLASTWGRTSARR